MSASRSIALVLAGCGALTSRAYAQDPCASCAAMPPDAAPPVLVEPPVTVASVPMRWRPPAPDPDPTANFLFRYELGAVYTHALERNLGGARLDIEVGADLRHFTVGGRFGLEAGATQSGLGYERLSAGFAVDGKLGNRVHIGLEPRIGVIIIDRVSDAYDPMSALTVGVHGEVRVALLAPGRRPQRTTSALELILRGGYDWMDVSNGNLDASNTVAIKLGLGGRY